MIARDFHPNNGYPIEMAVDPKVFEEKPQPVSNGGSSNPLDDLSLPGPMMVELIGAVKEAWKEIMYPPGPWDGSPIVDRRKAP